MSAYTTLRITRRVAMKKLIDAIYDGRLERQLLAKFMDHILEERLYNCRIVDDDEENDDDKL